MEKVYNLYYCGKQINTVPLTARDVEEIRRHDEVKIIRKRQMTVIPMKDVRIIERIIM